MAEEQKILIEIEVDSAGAEKALKETTVLIDQVTRNTKSYQEANKNLEKSNKELKGALEVGAVSQKRYNEEVQANNKRISENNEKIALNKNELTSLNKQRANSVSALNTENNSLNALRANLSKLTAERNNVNTGTAEGVKRFNELNVKIKEQNEAIKGLEESGGDFRRSVGNYQKALEGVIPGFTGFKDGIIASTKAAIGFIATPLGAILGALGLALGAVVSYLKGTQDGMEKLEIVSAALSTAWGVLVDAFRNVGRVIVDAVTKPQEAIKSLGNTLNTFVLDRINALLDGLGLLGSAIKKTFSGDFKGAAEDAAKGAKKIFIEANPVIAVVTKIGTAGAEAFSKIGKQAIEAGKAAATLKAQLFALEKQENDLILTRAKANAVIKEQNKIAEDVTKSLKEREAAASKAIETENKVLNEELRIANERARIIKQQNTLTESTEEDRKREIEADAKVQELRTRSFELQTTLTNKLNIIRNQAQAEEDRRNAEKTAQEEKDALALADKIEREKEASFELELFRKERDATLIEDEQAKAEALIEIEKFKRDALLENEALLEDEKTRIKEESQLRIDKINADATKKQIENTKKIAKVDALANQQKVEGASQALGGVAELFKTFGKDFRVFAIGQAAIDGVLAVQKTLASVPFPFNIAASIGVGATTLNNVKKISEQKFQKGGMIVGNSHANGGVKFAVGGQLGFEAEGGEAIINKKSMANPILRNFASAINVAGDGRSFATGGVLSSSSANSISSQDASNRLLGGLLSQIPAPIVTVSELNKVSNSVKVAENTAKI